VGRFLKLYTLLGLDEIAALEALEGADLREAKQRLAWEATAIVHGAEAADAARAGALAMVSGAASEDLPTHAVSAEAVAAGLRVVQVLADAGLTASLGQGRRLIQQGGVKLDHDRVEDADALLPAPGPEGAILRLGKKRAVRVVIA
jgi:tyrosyl-tRNA synthetase